MGRLDGKIAFVTGGARGIGRAIVEKFAAEGATVTFADLDERRRAARRSVSSAAAGIAASFCRADITVEAEVQHAIEGVVARHGTLDVLVNNAGVNAYFDATEMTEAEWDRRLRRRSQGRLAVREARAAADEARRPRVDRQHRLDSRLAHHRRACSRTPPRRRACSG